MHNLLPMMKNIYFRSMLSHCKKVESININKISLNRPKSIFWSSPAIKNDTFQTKLIQLSIKNEKNKKKNNNISIKFQVSFLFFN